MSPIEFLFLGFFLFLTFTPVLSGLVNYQWSGTATVIFILLAYPTTGLLVDNYLFLFTSYSSRVLNTKAHEY